jgi:hypothetical protein
MKMKWKVWIIGAVISIVLSLFVAMAGIAAGISWPQFLSILGAALVTHFGAYVTQHPVDKIKFDTTMVSKTSTHVDPVTQTITKQQSIETVATPVSQPVSIPPIEPPKLN